MGMTINNKELATDLNCHIEFEGIEDENVN